MAEKLCICCGKIPTNSVDKRCAICRIEGKPVPQASQREMQGGDKKKIIQGADLKKVAAVGRSSEANLADGALITMTKTKPPVPRKTSREKNSLKEGGIMPVTEENMGRKCSVEGCFKFAVKEGMCTRHYNEAHGIKKRIGRKPVKKDKDKSECSVDGCGNAVKSGGLCNKHYLRELKAKGRIGKSKRSSQKERRGPHTSVSAGSIPAPATNSHIAIDLSNFPKINKFISALPEIAPSDMLGVLLKQRLNELEERIAI